MNIVIYRYQLIQANWEWTSISDENLYKISAELLRTPFYGKDEESQFGFTQVGTYGKYITGLFIQKFKDFIINYDSKTKEEIKEEVINSGEYFFVLDLINRIVYLQAKKSKDLPDRKEINKRFRDQLIVVLEKFNLLFKDLEETKDEVDRNKIVNIFYHEADRVLEVDLKDFDAAMIEQEKRKRKGKRQTYFNPKEEYQEAMEAGAIQLALDAESVIIKAKKGASLKKDPITRAALEASRKPIKIVYEINKVTRTTFGVIERKVKVTLEDESFNLSDEKQVYILMSQLQFIDLPTKSNIKPGGLFNNETDNIQ